MCFSANVGRHYFLDFQEFCPYFQGFCPDFRQIKTHGVRFHPLHPRPLHHWPKMLLITGRVCEHERSTQSQQVLLCAKDTLMLCTNYIHAV